MAFGGVSEKNTEKQNLARIALKRLQATWKQKSYTQQEKVSRFYYFLPLFWTIPYDRFIPIQSLIITLLRNVILTVPRELIERNTEKPNLARIALKRLQKPWKQKLYRQQERVSRFYYSLPLSWTIPYDRSIPIQTLTITLLRNVMLTVPRELGLPGTKRRRTL